MAIVDYRLDPFLNVIDAKKISNEWHQVPSQSPYTIRLIEVPQKADPSTVVVKYENGTVLTEVAATPSQGQYWPDYNTTAHGIPDWNTGTLLFNAADAGKKVVVSYYGIGTLVDNRLPDQATVSVTSSTQRERNFTANGTSSAYDSYQESGSGNITSSTVIVKQHTGLPAGTYTLKQALQQLVNQSQTFEFIQSKRKYNCNCDCNCDCVDDGGSN